MNSLWQKFMDILFPAFCLGCSLEGTFLCKRCSTFIPRQKQQVCPFCLHPKSKGYTCYICSHVHKNLDGVFSFSAFEKHSLLQKCLHAYKYEFIEALGFPLSELLQEVLKQLTFDPVLLCPIPLHSQRLRWRGFNQSQILADFLAKSFKLPIQYLLQRTHFQKAQMELSQKERFKNMIHAFTVIKSLPKQTSILLIDDVATTLATLESAAEVLKNAGAFKVYGLVLARVYPDKVSVL